MKPYFEYIEDVKKKKILVCTQIQQCINRFEKLKERDDIYFDEQCVDDAIRFYSLMKHFKGKSAGKQFILSPWQTFILAYVLGLKYKDTGLRVVNEVYIQIARKAGKDAFIAGLCLYMLLIDQEASPEIVCSANSYPQAKILFEYIDKFAKNIDVKKNLIKHYKERLETAINNGKVEVVSSDASRLDGKNVSCAVVDEYHEAKDRKVYDVLKSSQLQRTQPLTIVITTAGFNLESPCYDMYKLSLEILAGIKELDNFASFIFQLDEDDDWTDPVNFIKCQPNLGVTVDSKSMLEEVRKAQVDSTAKSGVLTKTFNKWVASSTEWIPIEAVAKCMKPLRLEDFEGYSAAIGLDLSSVGDLTALCLLIQKDGINHYFNYAFLPEETLKNHPQSYYYQKFVDAGELIVTPGNVTDYDYIIAKIGELSRHVVIQAIYSDQWNATQCLLNLQGLGYNVEQFSQAIGNFNSPTKSLEKQIREGSCIINSSSMILWQFSHVTLKTDHNGNQKPNKEAYKEKIDNIIAMLEATGGVEKTPFLVDTEIFVF